MSHKTLAQQEIEELLRFSQKFEGILETYTEMGFEGAFALVVQDFRGITKGPSFNNVTNNWDGPEQDLHDLKWMASIKEGDTLVVFDKEGKNIEWISKIFNDRKEMAYHEYKVSIIPIGVQYQTWISWFKDRRKATLWKKN